MDRARSAPPVRVGCASRRILLTAVALALGSCKARTSRIHDCHDGGAGGSGGTTGTGGTIAATGGAGGRRDGGSTGSGGSFGGRRWSPGTGGASSGGERTRRMSSGGTGGLGRVSSTGTGGVAGAGSGGGAGAGGAAGAPGCTPTIPVHRPRHTDLQQPGRVGCRGRVPNPDLLRGEMPAEGRPAHRRLRHALQLRRDDRRVFQLVRIQRDSLYASTMGPDGKLWLADDKAKTIVRYDCRAPRSASSRRSRLLRGYGVRPGRQSLRVRRDQPATASCGSTPPPARRWARSCKVPSTCQSAGSPSTTVRSS